MLTGLQKGNFFPKIVGEGVLDIGLIVLRGGLKKGIETKKQRRSGSKGRAVNRKKREPLEDGSEAKGAVNPFNQKETTVIEKKKKGRSKASKTTALQRKDKARKGGVLIAGRRTVFEKELKSEKNHRWVKNKVMRRPAGEDFFFFKDGNGNRPAPYWISRVTRRKKV